MQDLACRVQDPVQLALLPHGPPIEGCTMSTDEKIAAILAAYPPVLRDANPVCICVCSQAIIFQANCDVNKNRLRTMNIFHRINLL